MTEHQRRIEEKIEGTRRSFPEIARTLPESSLLHRVYKHRQQACTTKGALLFEGCSGGVVDRMRDLTPALVITVTADDRLRVEGTSTAAEKIEMSLGSPLARDILRDVNARRMPRELFDQLVHKDIVMLAGQVVMRVVDMRGTGEGKPEVHKVLLRPHQNDIVRGFAEVNSTPYNDIDELIEQEAAIVHALNPTLALNEDAFHVLEYFYRYSSPRFASLHVPFDTSNGYAENRLMQSIQQARSRLQTIAAEPFMGVDTRRQLAKTKGTAGSAAIIRSTSLILPDITRYRIWRTIRYEETIHDTLQHYYSINFLVVLDTPLLVGNGNSSKEDIEQQPQHMLRFEVLFRMSPIRMDTAEAGFQYRFPLYSVAAVDAYIQQLRWTFSAESTGRRKCITDISNPNALVNTNLGSASSTTNASAGENGAVKDEATLSQQSTTQPAASAKKKIGGAANGNDSHGGGSGGAKKRSTENSSGSKPSKKQL